MVSFPLEGLAFFSGNHNVFHYLKGNKITLWFFLWAFLQSSITVWSVVAQNGYYWLLSAFESKIKIFLKLEIVESFINWNKSRLSKSFFEAKIDGQLSKMKIGDSLNSMTVRGLYKNPNFLLKKFGFCHLPHKPHVLRHTSFNIKNNFTASN